MQQQPEKLACPFYKANAAKSRLLRDNKRFKTCPLGFVDVKRLKEHLNRVHSLPRYRCERCSSIFNSQDKKIQHHQRPGGCEYFQDPYFKHIYIISPDDRDRILKTKKLTKVTSEQCWHAIWSVLFPDQPLPTSIYQKSSDVQHSIEWVITAFGQAMDACIPRIVARTLAPQVEEQYLRDTCNEILNYVTRLYDGGELQSPRDTNTSSISLTPQHPQRPQRPQHTSRGDAVPEPWMLGEQISHKLTDVSNEGFGVLYDPTSPDQTVGSSLSDTFVNDFDLQAGSVGKSTNGYFEAVTLQPSWIENPTTTRHSGREKGKNGGDTNA